MAGGAEGKAEKAITVLCLSFSSRTCFVKIVIFVNVSSQSYHTSKDVYLYFVPSNNAVTNPFLNSV